MTSGTPKGVVAFSNEVEYPEFPDPDNRDERLAERSSALTYCDDRSFLLAPYTNICTRSGSGRLHRQSYSAVM